MLVTRKDPTLVLGLTALLGIWLATASAASLNHLIERYIDQKMTRTRNRPMAQEKIQPRSVIIFSTVLATCSMVILFTQVNALTASLTLASLVGYAFVYTIWLKRATHQNIVIGGIFGATPPLLGYSAINGELDALAWQMFLIIFLWTPSHFWALALARKTDYELAGLPMLPNTHGEKQCCLHILLYTILLLIASSLPWLTLQAGAIYGVGQLGLGALYLYYVLRLQLNMNENRALSVFYFSIHYLIWLFAILIIDHYVFLTTINLG